MVSKWRAPGSEEQVGGPGEAGVGGGVKGDRGGGVGAPRGVVPSRTLKRALQPSCPWLFYEREKNERAALPPPPLASLWLSPLAQVAPSLPPSLLFPRILWQFLSFFSTPLLFVTLIRACFFCFFLKKNQPSNLILPAWEFRKKSSVLVCGSSDSTGFFFFLFPLYSNWLGCFPRWLQPICRS